MRKQIQLLSVGALLFVAVHGLPAQNQYSVMPNSAYKTHVLQLTPALPDSFFRAKLNKSWPPKVGSTMFGMALVAGDLNGDEVPDLVFSNELGFLRVYLLQDPPSGLSVSGQGIDIFSPPTQTQQCSTTGPNARFLSLSVGVFSRPVIYDIDLDGQNELIYLTHIPSSNNYGSVGLQVWDYNATSGSFVPQFASPVNLGGPSGVTREDKYFASDCNKPLPCCNRMDIRIGNLRGRAIPQDIIVHGTDRVGVYAYDSNGPASPTISKLIGHSPNSSWIPMTKGRNYDGHTWAPYDIDNDGVEELLGGQVVKWDVFQWDAQNQPAPKTVVMWGPILVQNEQPCQQGCLANNTHIDSVAAADLIKSYVNSNGELVPSPGAEIVFAAQLDRNQTVKVVPPSGPWVYNGLQGHSLTPKGGNPPRVWPRKTINYDSDYEFNVLNVPPEPAHASFRASHWKDYDAHLNALKSGMPPNPQTVPIVHLLGDQEGPSILLHQKFSELNISQAGNYTLIHGEPTLPLLDWDMIVPTNSPETWRLIPDATIFFDAHCSDRRVMSAVSAHWPNNLLHPVLSIHTFADATSNSWGSGPRPATAGFSTQNEPRQFRPIEHFWLQSIQWDQKKEDIKVTEGVAAADFTGDSREELILFRKYDHNGKPEGWQLFRKSEAILIYNSQECARPEPPPQRFIDYRRYRHQIWQPDYVDMKEFSGFRLYTKHLLRGSHGRAYGVLQDKAIVDPGNPGQQLTGCVILAEGGTPNASGNYSYTYSIAAGALPVGLTATQVTIPTGSTSISNGLLIHGTSPEVGVHRIVVRATDQNAPGGPHSIYKMYWLHMEHGAPALPFSPTQPVITAAGFDGAYVRANSMDSVLFKAWVSDNSPAGPRSDTQVVVVFFNGIHVASLNDLGQNGDATAGDGVFSHLFQNVGMLLPRGDYGCTLYALDSAGNVSEPWPFVTAHGQREHTGILFDALPKRTQTLATTPTIDRVQMPWWNLEPTLQPASKFKLSTTPLSHPVNVYVKRVPSGMYIKTVRCRLHHNHAKKFYQKDSSFGANHQGSLYGATIDLPPGHFGSGSYVMQVQVVATDGKNDYDSDWWPRLTVH